ncbi:amidohydrolase [Gimibacter soli]|uniref:Amidohydrolase n=1 Tax=Gimibacter soli TaxID=3024400 RepID=A0AAE9XND5_9PROT|nr:amidohydrolase [Gimibacter soli]WCL54218.1 amidohydrolase [Gimibacter soli]
MRHLWKAAVGLSFLLAACSVESEVETPLADTIIWGGPVYTADDGNPTAEAVAIKDGRIMGVGNRADIALLVGPSTQIIDLAGAALFPGFTDSHAHLDGIGRRELTLDLTGTASVSDLQARLQSWREAHPEDTIVAGLGWIETHWPEKRFPTAADLDLAIADVPVILSRADGHAVIVNSAALKAAGITADTEPPFGGDILKDEAGEPTGMLIDNAMGLVQKLIPEPGATEQTKFLKVGAELYAHRGWTGMHYMSAAWSDVPLLTDLSSSDEVGIRVYVVPDGARAGALLEDGPVTNENGRIITRAIKLYVDGALGSRGAALLEPYADAHTSGLMLISEEEAKGYMRKALKHGVQVATHAIGDKGNRVLLDWYKDVLKGKLDDDLRWRIEHVQVITDEDAPRMKAMGIIPSMQPSHVISDMHFAPARLGPDRIHEAYAWRTVLRAGSIIAGGSDAPVEKGDPLVEFYAAIGRTDLSGYQGPDWQADQVMTRDEALKAFTIWPATASFQEKDIGTISIGKKADLTAFSVDLMTAPLADIPNGHAVLTMVDGKVLFQNR